MRRPLRALSRSSTRRPRAARALAAIRALPDHQLLDRVVRGRVWIGLLGAMLAGIVAMQVEVLKLGASMGRSLQRTTTLQSRNEQLRATAASLADDHRIERLAAAMGMVIPAPDGVGFLPASSGTNVQQAISNIHSPDPASFLSLLTANGTVTGTSASALGTGSGGSGQGSASSGVTTGTTGSSPSVSSPANGPVTGGASTGATTSAGGSYPGTGPGNGIGGATGAGTISPGTAPTGLASPAAGTSGGVGIAQPATGGSGTPSGGR